MAVTKFLNAVLYPPDPDWYADGGGSYPSVIKYPKHRDSALKSPYGWLWSKELDDGAEGLWRIGDGLYDLAEFVDAHPGGRNWLTLTKGLDITEAFETHHMTSIPESMLRKYYVRQAKTPRNYPWTFAEDGFYKTLKRRVRQRMSELPPDVSHKSHRIIEGLALAMFAFSAAACLAESPILGTINCLFAGLCMAWTATCAHNFLHQRDNWRMYLFNFALLATREFRITHVLSHHLYTNTVLDAEITGFEPFFQWLPIKTKSFFVRYGALAYGFFLYPILFHANFVLRYVGAIAFWNVYPVLDKEDLVALVLPTFMYLIGGRSLQYTIVTWLIITHVSSFVVTMTTIHAAHHHPDNFHDGDEPCEDRDWGLHQLDAVMDRVDINGSLFRVLTNFGDHGLHHLFPSVDHAVFAEVQPEFERTCREFATGLRMSSIVDMFFGSFRQIARIERRRRTGRKPK